MNIVENVRQYLSSFLVLGVTRRKRVNRSERIRVEVKKRYEQQLGFSEWQFGQKERDLERRLIK